MRAYIPCESDALEGDTPQFIPLKESAVVWGAPASVLEGMKPDDAEAIEYEALCEAAVVSALSHKGTERVVIAAADLDERNLRACPGDDTGQYAHELLNATNPKIAAYLVSENLATEVVDDEYAPEMLWFDPSEYGAMWEFAKGR